MCLTHVMTLLSDKKISFLDADVFKTIFDDHWEYFKKVHRRYDHEQYEAPVQKMLGCRDASNGYSEYICMHCGQDRRKIPFSCKSCFCLSWLKRYFDSSEMN
ncbi:transposase zinc-binding domain-containing protein [uncultured Desulfobacter sp.]|uniref:transposase zinc-binding domain-containing protein n=1 Tax=uncultured Desulfobacter sp. TaxID=240139 RepID=UPI003748DB86